MPTPGDFAPPKPLCSGSPAAVHSAQGCHIYFPFCPRWSYPQEPFPHLIQFSDRSFLIRETFPNNLKQALFLPFLCCTFLYSTRARGRKQKYFSLFSLIQLSYMEVQTQFVLLTAFPAPNPYTFVEWIFRESLWYDLGMRRGISCYPVLQYVT